MAQSGWQLFAESGPNDRANELAAQPASLIVVIGTGLRGEWSWNRVTGRDDVTEIGLWPKSRTPATPLRSDSGDIILGFKSIVNRCLKIHRKWIFTLAMNFSLALDVKGLLTGVAVVHSLMNCGCTTAAALLAGSLRLSGWCGLRNANSVPA